MKYPDFYEEIPCNLCGSNRVTNMFYAHDWGSPSNEEFRIVKCKNCNLAYLNPRPNRNNLLNYYPKEYYTHD